MKKTTVLSIALVALLLIAATAAGILLIPQKKEILTAEAIRNGGTALVCEDALWLYETNKAFISEKFAQIPEDNLSEADLQAEFWNNVTPAQGAVIAWHNEVLTAIGEKTRGNPEAGRVFSYNVGNDMLRLYQTAMAVTIGIADEETAVTGIEDEYCK
jgi:hypothetical protein